MAYKYREILTSYKKNNKSKKEELGKKYKSTLVDSLEEEFGKLTTSDTIVEEYYTEIHSAYEDMHTAWNKFKVKAHPTSLQIEKLEEAYDSLQEFKDKFRKVIKESL